MGISPRSTVSEHLIQTLTHQLPLRVLVRTADPDVTDSFGHGFFLEKSVRSGICGHWRIVWMELWDDDYINCVVPGYIKMRADGFGEFQFGVVEGSFHVAPERSSFDSKWEGANECDEALGEIDGMIEIIDQQEELQGTISFWGGDESDYKAVRVNLK